MVAEGAQEVCLTSSRIASAMKIEQLLSHHGIAANPFTDEDAQTDPVFKEHCLLGAHHPAWGKIYGDPSEPATSVVFGEKGSGKTAMRLQIVRHIDDYNRAHPTQRAYVIEYDDFNPFLDRFRDRQRVRRRQTDRMLDQWKLWDHMDAILSLGVTGLVDQALATGRGASSQNGAPALDLRALDRHRARDFLLLAACYDQSTAETFRGRWHRLRRKLRFHTFLARRWFALGLLVTLVVVGLLIGLQKDEWLSTPWPYLAVAAGWVPWLLRVIKMTLEAHGIARQLRVVNHATNPLRQVLMRFTPDELANQPLPNKDRTDDRYELLFKLQNVLKSLGYGGIIVLVDRVDEPHLINGSPELMRALLWPMLDNKFLKHPGLGYSKCCCRSNCRTSSIARIASFTSEPGSTSRILSRRWNGPARQHVRSAAWPSMRGSRPAPPRARIPGCAICSMIR